jgi:putative acyl-CoA dehydrogenase
MLREPQQLERRGRELAEGLALLAAGTILREHAPAAVADAFMGTRLGQFARHTYGQGLDRADVAAIIERALPG